MHKIDNTKLDHEKGQEQQMLQFGHSVYKLVISFKEFSSAYKLNKMQ